MTMMISLFKFV